MGRTHRNDDSMSDFLDEFDLGPTDCGMIDEDFDHDMLDEMIDSPL